MKGSNEGQQKRVELTADQQALAHFIAVNGKKPYKVIAVEMNIPLDTLNSRLKIIREKLGIRSRHELAQWAVNFLLPKGTMDSLDGYWLSKFEYQSYDPISESSQVGVQINLEHVMKSTEPYFSHQGHCALQQTVKRRPFLHRFYFKCVNQQVVGIWQNDNSQSIGCFQLHVLNDNQIMKGKHLGNSSNGLVQHGAWTWKKVVEPRRSINIELQQLKPYAQLDDIWEASVFNKTPLLLDDLMV